MVLSSALEVLGKCFNLAEYSQKELTSDAIIHRDGSKTRQCGSFTPTQRGKWVVSDNGTSMFVWMMRRLLRLLKGVDDGGVIILSEAGI